MSSFAPTSSHARRSTRTPTVFAVTALTAAAAAGVVTSVLAPQEARAWVAAVSAGAWMALAIAAFLGVTAWRRENHRCRRAQEEVAGLHHQHAAADADMHRLASETLPEAVHRLQQGASPAEALQGLHKPLHPQLGSVLGTSVSALHHAVDQAQQATGECEVLAGRLKETGEEIDHLVTALLPAAVRALREGASPATALEQLEPPRIEQLRVLLSSVTRELGLSERRAAAARGASTKALSRVQAMAVSMLADLREMQDRHGQEVFGDLLQLDHSTSQLGLLTDRLALLLGGRPSRAWNRPIGMESVLRGAVGRIAAYRRVRLHCASTAAVAGYAAEGVMHLLAELSENAANFSPPTDEVHVYVEEIITGVVVTIEDSGLGMSERARRRAVESVGRPQDLAELRGTRLGLVVVGVLADRYGIDVTFHRSSRGGTGAVVMIPRQLLAAADGVQYEPLPAGGPRPVRNQNMNPVSDADAAVPPASVAPAALPAAPAASGKEVTDGGLPVRARGRTMADAESRRPDRAAHTTPPTPRRTAGDQFAAFSSSQHRPQDGPGTP